jgi:phospholipid/cholesterol/gamma-HCH transport system substrate-binding protein
MRQESREGIASAGGPTRGELERATPATAGGREVRVGIFILLGLISTVILLFLLTDPATFRGRYMLVTEVPDAGGVRRGDPVQMRGVNIGRVRDFQMRPPRVAITLEIDGRWRIPVDSHTRITGLGLLDGRTIEVVPGDAEETLPAGSMIPGRAVNGVMEMADTFGDEALAIARSVRTLLDEATVDHLQTSAADLDRLLDVLTTTAEEQRFELQRLSGTLASSAERIDDVLAREELDRAIARTDSTLALLQETGGSLDRASRSLEGILQRVEEGEGTLGQLATNDELYRTLNDAAEAILFLAEDIRENPSRYIRLRIF